MRGNIDIVKLLLDHGAGLMKNLDLGTPLHHAAYAGKTDMVGLLLER
jgi:ankyrin repeat protein